MSKLISCSIDLTKIDKTRIKEVNGKKWYNFDVWENREPDRFENTHSIKPTPTKEERAQKVKLPYIGNGKLFEFGGGEGRAASKPETRSRPAFDPDEAIDEDVPF